MSKAKNTRLAILQKAFDLIYKKGYQATSIDDIIATTEVTKGAFYYHFKNKEEMGLAMINEVMYPGMHQSLIEPLMGTGDPIDEIYLMAQNVLLNEPFFQLKYGCPAINLIEEMSPLNKSFHRALSKLLNEWQKAIEDKIQKGKESGQLRKEVVPQQVALFIITGYAGIRNTGKLLGMKSYEIYLRELNLYLNALVK